jgi:hypothetical protein
MTMSPALSKAIDDAKLDRILDEIHDAKQQINARPSRNSGGFTEEQEKEEIEQDHRLGERLLPAATGKLRKAMYDIGRACALDPAYKTTAGVNEGTFEKLFGQLGPDIARRLLAEPAAKEGFQAGMDSIPLK